MPTPRRTLRPLLPHLMPQRSLVERLHALPPPVAAVKTDRRVPVPGLGAKPPGPKIQKIRCSGPQNSKMGKSPGVKLKKMGVRIKPKKVKRSWRGRFAGSKINVSTTC